MGLTVWDIDRTHERRDGQTRHFGNCLDGDAAL